MNAYTQSCKTSEPLTEFNYKHRQLLEKKKKCHMIESAEKSFYVFVSCCDFV